MHPSSIADLAGFASLPAEPAPARRLSDDQRSLIQAVKALNGANLFGEDNELTFILDRASRQAIVRIVNKKTREVVEQIPAEYVVRMAAEMKRD
jgi:uncharacterized FlaG/YvyC family protein